MGNTDRALHILCLGGKNGNLGRKIVFGEVGSNFIMGCLFYLLFPLAEGGISTVVAVLGLMVGS